MSEEQSNPPEFHQLDFWLGDWEVSWEADGAGTNKVERILDGQVIQESFDAGPEMPFRGLSWSVFHKRTGGWRQTWVDTDGNYWNFEGEYRDGRMIFATDDVSDGRPVKLRMVFFDIQDDRLEWNWEQSLDGGKSWDLKWNIHYKRRT